AEALQRAPKMRVGALPELAASRSEHLDEALLDRRRVRDFEGREWRGPESALRIETAQQDGLSSGFRETGERLPTRVRIERIDVVGVFAAMPVDKRVEPLGNPLPCPSHRADRREQRALEHRFLAHVGRSAERFLERRERERSSLAGEERSKT